MGSDLDFTSPVSETYQTPTPVWSDTYDHVMLLQTINVTSTFGSMLNFSTTLGEIGEFDLFWDVEKGDGAALADIDYGIIFIP